MSFCWPLLSTFTVKEALRKSHQNEILSIHHTCWRITKCVVTSVCLHKNVYTNGNCTIAGNKNTSPTKFRLITAEGTGYVSMKVEGLSFHARVPRPGVPFPSQLLQSITLSLHDTFFTVSHVRGWKTRSCLQVCKEKSERVGGRCRYKPRDLAYFDWLDSSRLTCVIREPRVLSETVSDIEVGIKWVEERPECILTI